MQEHHSQEQSVPTLSATDIDAGYGEHKVLDGVSVESHDGVTCIFGPNGSGKSTLLKTLNGIVEPGQGRSRTAT